MTEEVKHIKKSMLYTKTGDKGITSLYNGEKLPKNDIHFEVVGTLDEVSSAISLFYVEYDHAYILKENVESKKSNEVHNRLEWVQSRLLDLGSHVATPIDTTSSHSKLERTSFDEEHVKTLERWIDEYDAQLPKLTNFILPRGSLHLARSVCRRAERLMVELMENRKISEHAFVFINRLSDFLFVCARYVSYFVLYTDEIVYKK